MPATKTKRKTKTIVDQLRTAIVATELTSYRLGKDAGVSPGVIDRFVSGERDIRLETAARLATALGIELR
jgi:plasmid maintenance system antidote protein VapI